MQEVRDGVTNKKKPSIEHECLQDFPWLERPGRVYKDILKRDRKVQVSQNRTYCENLIEMVPYNNTLLSGLNAKSKSTEINFKKKVVRLCIQRCE